MATFTAIIEFDADDQDHAAQQVNGWTISPNARVSSITGMIDVTGGQVNADDAGHVTIPPTEYHVDIVLTS